MNRKTMEGKQRLLESCGGVMWVENMDIELFKLFICRCSYCYTNSHTRIYHMHTTSVHRYHQLWVVAL